MPEITANLTVAWLDAFARVQTRSDLLDRIAQQSRGSSQNETLTDVIESVLRTGGLPREPASDAQKDELQRDAQNATTAASGVVPVLDVTV